MPTGEAALQMEDRGDADDGRVTVVRVHRVRLQAEAPGHGGQSGQIRAAAPQTCGIDQRVVVDLQPQPGRRARQGRRSTVVPRPLPYECPPSPVERRVVLDTASADQRPPPPTSCVPLMPMEFLLPVTWFLTHVAAALIHPRNDRPPRTVRSSASPTGRRELP